MFGFLLKREATPQKCHKNIPPKSTSILTEEKSSSIASIILYLALLSDCLEKVKKGYQKTFEMKP